MIVRTWETRKWQNETTHERISRVLCDGEQPRLYDPLNVIERVLILTPVIRFTDALILSLIASYTRNTRSSLVGGTISRKYRARYNNTVRDERSRDQLSILCLRAGTKETDIYVYIYIRTSCNTERERGGGRTRKKEMAGNGERKASGWNTEWPPSVSIQAFTRHPPLHPPLLASLFQLLVCSSFSLCSHRQRWCTNAKKKGKKRKRKKVFS